MKPNTKVKVTTMKTKAGMEGKIISRDWVRDEQLYLVQFKSHRAWLRMEDIEVVR